MYGIEKKMIGSEWDGQGGGEKMRRFENENGFARCVWRKKTLCASVCVM